MEGYHVFDAFLGAGVIHTYLNFRAPKVNKWARFGFSVAVLLMILVSHKYDIGGLF